MDKNEIERTVDSTYIQQHLANERTYLAWIRTALAFIGIGFIVFNLHFTSHSLNLNISDVFAKWIGYSSVGLGILTIIIATLGYFKKGKAINAQTFTYPKMFITIFSSLSITIILFFWLYFLLEWW